MTSSNRSREPLSADGDRPHDERVVVGPDSSGNVPVRDDERTVISSRPPLSNSDDGPLGIELGSLKPGDMLGHYEVLEYIGGGGMGRVFLAQDTELGRRVALKVLLREQAADTETLLRFRNEARSAARLDHENIARVYHVGEDQGLPYLIFEFVEGPTIRAVVEQQGPLSLGQALSYTLQVANALVHVAEQGVVHRDIKPSNIIITADDRVKVIDLGLARIQQDEQSGSDLTASGVTLGTFDYISPEQARDPRIVDTRSDIYSLGCAFFYMLAARPPFPEGTVLQKLLQHQG
ncbi:MAG: serine/threonine protein kinase, partial [Pirellulales bacterium]|nr:serine/threonine protein kinase [Pirellulales bacterium]